MGILNVTPDSFSDGGRYRSTTAAVQHALQMVQDGASVIDIGGESSRPGSKPVSVVTELKRVIPVIKALRKKTTIPISIDFFVKYAYNDYKLALATTSLLRLGGQNKKFLQLFQYSLEVSAI